MARKSGVPTTVWRFEIYDNTYDQYVTSARYATEDVIAKIGGRRIEGTEITIGSSDLDGNGMTEKSFEPKQPA